MFQSIRQNSTIYIFHKGDNPRLEMGYVTSVTPPKPKYQVPPTFGQSQEMIVDIVAKINGQIVNYNSLPAQADIADSFSNGETIVISDTKEAMNAEIISLKQKSSDIVNSIEYHKKLMVDCDKILADLNPEFAEKQAQQEEINSLKSQMVEMSKNMNELMNANKKLIQEISKHK